MTIKIVLMVGLGFICLLVATVGLFVPILPTTPFLILSVGCFSSTPKIKNKLLTIPFFKEHLLNYENRTGLPKKSVISSLIFIWIMILISIILIKNIYMAVSLLIIASLVSIHILYMAKPKAIHGNYYEK